MAASSRYRLLDEERYCHFCLILQNSLVLKQIFDMLLILTVHHCLCNQKCIEFKVTKCTLFLGSTVCRNSEHWSDCWHCHCCHCPIHLHWCLHLHHLCCCPPRSLLCIQLTSQLQCHNNHQHSGAFCPSDHTFPACIGAETTSTSV